MKIYVDKFISKKTQKEYIRAYVDLGYTKKIIAVGEQDVAELVDCSPRQLHERLKKEPTIIL